MDIFLKMIHSEERYITRKGYIVQKDIFGAKKNKKKNKVKTKKKQKNVEFDLFSIEFDT